MCLHEGIIPMGISLMRELRCLDNWEPIEIYHCNELLPDTVDLIYSIDNNVRVIDICSQLVDQGRFENFADKDFQNYWVKPLAVHESNLSEIILMDADVLLLTNPAVLRDVRGYKENGTVFFYDRVLPYRLFSNRFGTENGTEFVFDSRINDQEIIKRSWTEDVGADEVQYLHHWVENFDYEIFNTTYGPSQHLLDSLIYASETAHEQDSSILLIDKTTADRAMAVLWYLITDHRFRFKFSWYVLIVLFIAFTHFSRLAVGERGDKEAFWLSFEFSHTPYAFSPWGASVVSSTTNRDMELHPETLCGSLAHFMPVNDTEPELLYVNGKALIDPVPMKTNSSAPVRPNHFFNMMPTHVTPRHERSPVVKADRGRFFSECLVDLGSMPVPPTFRDRLWRRRIHFLAIAMNKTEMVETC